jgi:hypothetical protein
MAEENRSKGRSNVFLTATLDCGGRTMPVRIRNLSARGALVDGNALPPAGTRVRLLRGRLAALGEIAWETNVQGGLKFDADVDVASWVRRLGHSGQERVDGVIAALRSGEPRNLKKASAPKESLPVISAALDQICERLGAHPGMSIELGEDLMKLDAIAQSLRRIATGRAY